MVGSRIVVALITMVSHNEGTMDMNGVTRWRGWVMESSRDTYELGEDGYDGVKGCYELKGVEYFKPLNF